MLGYLLIYIAGFNVDLGVFLHDIGTTSSYLNQTIEFSLLIVITFIVFDINKSFPEIQISQPSKKNLFYKLIYFPFNAPDNRLRLLE